MAVIKNGTLSLDLTQAVYSDVVMVDGQLKLLSTGSYLDYSTSNSVPTMISNTLPKGIAAGLGGATAWKAFDKDLASYTGGSITYPATISYDFQTQKIIYRYSVAMTSSTYYANAWQFQGSNNGSTWITLDSRSEETGMFGTRKNYDITTPQSFSMYRLNLTAGSSNNQVYLAEFEMFEVSTNYNYKNFGSAEFKTIDLGSLFREITAISSIKNVPPNTNLNIYTSTSSDNYTFSDWILLNANGTIASPQKRYVKVKVEMAGNNLITKNTLNTFNLTEISQFEPNDSIIFDGFLRLITDYNETVTNDAVWLDSGVVFKTNLKKNNYKNIETIVVS